MVFFFIEDSSIIHSSKSTFLVFDWKVDSSFKKSFNLMFEKEQSSIQLLSSISGNNNFIAAWKELILEFEEGSFEVAKNGDVWATSNEDVLSTFDFRPSEEGLWFTDKVIDFSFQISLIGCGLAGWSNSVRAAALICWHWLKIIDKIFSEYSNLRSTLKISI